MRKARWCEFPSPTATSSAAKTGVIWGIPTATATPGAPSTARAIFANNAVCAVAATASIAQRIPISFVYCVAWRSAIAHPAKNLQEPCRPQHGAPHVRRRTAVEAEPLFRLLEMTADDVREVVKVDLRVGIE